MDISDRSSQRHSTRQLRLITILVFIPGIILLLKAGLSIRMELPFLSIMLMTMSSFIGLISIASKGKPTSWMMYADFRMAMFLICVLIPTWVFLAEHNYINANQVLLCAYGTMPLIVDFCIHSYLCLRALPNINTFITQTCSHCNQARACPNCNHAVPPTDVPRWRIFRDSVPDHQFEPVANGRAERSYGNADNCYHNKDLYQPFVTTDLAERAARESSEFQTSGHNTPRRSAETLDSEFAVSGRGESIERDSGSLV